MKISILSCNLKKIYKIIVLFSFISSVFCLITINVAHAKERKFILTLDAGHGGYDYGAIHDSLNEKYIALAIVLKLGRKIELEQKDVKVIYTRFNDLYLNLYHRSAIANFNKSNLFISIHCNSSKELNTSAMGTETWILTYKLTPKKSDFWTSSKEDYKISLDKIYQDIYHNYNHTYSIPDIFIGIKSMQDKLLKNSCHFALMMEKNFQVKATRFSRGIKQSDFFILLNSMMPSVLIEVGFLNHPEEFYYLRSEYGQNKIVNSIYETFCKYKEAYYKHSRN